MIGRMVRFALRRERRRLRQHRYAQQEENTQKPPVAVNRARHDLPVLPGCSRITSGGKCTSLHTYSLFYVSGKAKVTRSTGRVPSGAFRNFRNFRNWAAPASVRPFWPHPPPAPRWTRPRTTKSTSGGARRMELSCWAGRFFGSLGCGRSTRRGRVATAARGKLVRVSSPTARCGGRGPGFVSSDRHSSACRRRRHTGKPAGHEQLARFVYDLRHLDLEPRRYSFSWSHSNRRSITPGNTGGRSRRCCFRTTQPGRFASENAVVVQKLSLDAEYFERNVPGMRYQSFANAVSMPARVVEAGCKTVIGPMLRHVLDRRRC
jgi:hypothetical protein